jgi:ribonuclease Y
MDGVSGEVTDFAMSDPTYLVVTGAVLLLAGVCIFLGFGIGRRRERSFLAAVDRERAGLLESAKREAEVVVREARLAANEEALKLRAETEKRLNEREALVNRQLENLVREEKSVRGQRKELEDKLADVQRLQKESEDLVQKGREHLAGLAKLSEAEARAAFLQEVQSSSLHDAAQMSQHILEDAKVHAEEKARRILTVAVQRYAGNHTFETSTATVNIKGEEMKGRIIGREGRNIRAFESATGVTVLIDDTPGAVVLSGFDPVRREIAREAMERLILDGRIHPARIEEVVGKVTEEMDASILRTGNEAVLNLGLAPMHVEIVKLLGRLHFRHSFSQNVLSHSIEVAHLAGLMAAELGIDAASARRAGLLHDIGKAVSHEIVGPHALVGAEIVQRHGEPETIVTAVASHHGEAPTSSLLGILIGAADAISASRPGARSETALTYIQRVENLERIGLSFPGVEKCFAMQAGRELRVMVQPAQVSDEQAFMLARNIARKVEDDLQYPGQIRVTIVRETRCVEFAK